MSFIKKKTIQFNLSLIQPIKPQVLAPYEEYDESIPLKMLGFVFCLVGFGLCCLAISLASLAPPHFPETLHCMFIP